jgi:hypothetical protein
MPKGSTIFIHLTEEQDKQLRTLELSPNINHKVRLRASIYRLKLQGFCGSSSLLVQPQKWSI